MANELSTASLENALYELSTTLSSAEWDDGVKDSYYTFINEERNLISSISWHLDRASSVYNSALSEDTAKLRSSLSECHSKLQRLERGG